MADLDFDDLPPADDYIDKPKAKEENFDDLPEPTFDDLPEPIAEKKEGYGLKDFGKDVAQAVPFIPDDMDFAGRANALGSSLTDVPVIRPAIRKAARKVGPSIEALYDKLIHGKKYDEALAERQKAFDAERGAADKEAAEDRSKHKDAALIGTVTQALATPIKGFSGETFLGKTAALTGNATVAGGISAADTKLRSGSNMDAAKNALITGGTVAGIGALPVALSATRGAANFARKNVFGVADDLADDYRSLRPEVKKTLESMGKDATSRDLVSELQEKLQSAHARYVSNPTQEAKQAVEVAQDAYNAYKSEVDDMYDALTFETRSHVANKKNAADLANLKAKEVRDMEISAARADADKADDVYKAAERELRDDYRSVQGETRQAVKDAGQDLSISKQKLKEELGSKKLPEETSSQLIQARKDVSNRGRESLRAEFDILEKSGIEHVPTRPVLDVLDAAKKELEHRGIPRPGYKDDHAVVAELISDLEHYSGYMTPKEAREVLMGMNKSLTDAYAKKGVGGRTAMAENIADNARAALRENIRAGLPDDVRRVYEKQASETARLTNISKKMDKVLGNVDEMNITKKLESVAKEGNPVKMRAVDAFDKEAGKSFSSQLSELHKAHATKSSPSAIDDLLKDKISAVRNHSADAASMSSSRVDPVLRETMAQSPEAAELAAKKAALDSLRSKPMGTVPEDLDLSRAKSDAADLVDTRYHPELGAHPVSKVKEMTVAESQQAKALEEARRNLAEKQAGATGLEKMSTNRPFVERAVNNRPNANETEQLRKLSELSGEDFVKEKDIVSVVSRLNQTNKNGSSHNKLLESIPLLPKFMGNMVAAGVGTSGRRIGANILDIQDSLAKGGMAKAASALGSIAEKHGLDAALTIHRLMLQKDPEYRKAMEDGE